MLEAVLMFVHTIRRAHVGISVARALLFVLS